MRRKLNILTALLFYLITNTQYNSAYAQTNAPLRRPISPSKPMWLIHIDTWNYADPQKIIDLVPKDIRPYVVMNIALSISHDEATSRFKVAEYGYEIAKSWLRTCAENRMWAMVQPSSGAYSQFSDFDLSVYEEFYRDYPNMIGFNYCEQSWGYGDSDPLATAWTDRIAHFSDLLELSDQYGGYLVVSWCGNKWVPSINPIAMLKRNPSFAAACSQYTDNFIMCEKYTFQTYQSDMESLCLGTWLSGYSGQYGIRYDDTGWTDRDGNHANFTMATYGAPFLEHVMLTGQTVIDAPELIWMQCFREVSEGPAGDDYTMRQWETFPQFDNVSVDLFRKILDGTVRIPSRKEVIDRTKVVIINDVNSGSDNEIYSSPWNLFYGLYRMDDDGYYEYNKSFFKKTGRYPTVPTVYQLDDSLAKTFEVQVNKTDYSSRWPAIADKVSEFDSLFPEKYAGDLYAGRHENGWVTYNPYKTGQTARGSIPFKYNTCDSMELMYSQYTAGVVKEYSDYLTIYLSNYDNVINTDLKTDTIKIYGSSSEPVYSFTDRADHQASKIVKSWADGVFTLNVSHNGALDITVNCSGTATDRLTAYQTANVIVPRCPDVYRGPGQYEAEHFDYKNIVGIVKSGYDRSIRNYTGQGYLQFGTSNTASVRDNVSVLNDGTYTLETRYTVTGGDVNTIDLYVNGSKATTPTFTQTSSLSSWAVNSQHVVLNKGVNTIELKASTAAAQTIYFDNMVIRSDDSVNIWLEAECGNLGLLWETSSDSDASNGEYVTIQPGNDSTGSAPADSSGHITYGFNVTDSGTYTVWGRVIAPTTDDNAFWVKMDSATWLSWDDIQPSTSWTWVAVDTFTLTEGEHTFVVAYNEDGTQLDKLFITISDTIPTGKGGPATNCITSNQSPYAYAGSNKTAIDNDGNGSETVILNGTGSVDPDGSIASYAWYEGDSLIATGANSSVDISVGVHDITLMVTDNEGATDIDDVLITVFEGNFEESEFWFEAECGAVGGNWNILNDAQASNEHYVTVKSGVQSLNQAPAGDENLILISFSVTISDTYAAFARLNCPTWDDDSYWVKMDDGAFQMYNGLVTSGWEWIKFNDYALTEGEHTFSIAYREDGAKLDKIYISNHQITPLGTGEEAENLCVPTGYENSLEVKKEYALEQNYPNPFNSLTTIKYNIEKPGHVYLRIYDLNGQEIETIVNKYQTAGEHVIMWQAKGLSGGVYIYRLETREISETRRLILLK